MIETPLGEMVVIANDEALFLLEFTDRRRLDHQIEQLSVKTQLRIVPGVTEITRSIQSELGLYFSGKLKSFKTNIALVGSAFQKKIWEELRKIPYGEFRAYSELAKSINQPLAYRAVAQANGGNRLALIVPCHRVINIDQSLGGYAGGVDRKAWLLKHENILI